MNFWNEFSRYLWDLKPQDYVLIMVAALLLGFVFLRGRDMRSKY